MWYKLNFSEEEISNGNVSDFQNFTNAYVLTHQVSVFKRISDDNPFEYALFIHSINSLYNENLLKKFNVEEILCPIDENLGCFMGNAELLKNIIDLK